MCGIVGVVSNAPVNQLIYDALLLLQHRGQDAAGIATYDADRIQLRKKNGFVRDVFQERHMLRLKGNMGIVFDAHNRQLITPNSPFERYVRDQDGSAISERAKNGLRLFIGKASCVDCHNGPALSDGGFHND